MYNYNYLNNYDSRNMMNDNSYVSNYDNLRSIMNENSYIPNYDNFNYESTRTNEDRNIYQDNMLELNRNIGNMNLYSPKEGYMKGNLFADLYNQYKNYKPAKLEPTDERQKLYLKLNQVSFAAHELNLYLDLHPEDKEALKLFNQYRVKANQLLEKYENEYGPLTISSDALNTSPFLWEEQDFPFEKGGVSNV